MRVNGQHTVVAQKAYRMERIVLTVEITKDIFFSEGINLGYTCATKWRPNAGLGFTKQRRECGLFGWNDNLITCNRFSYCPATFIFRIILRKICTSVPINIGSRRRKQIYCWGNTYYIRSLSHLILNGSSRFFRSVVLCVPTLRQKQTKGFRYLRKKLKWYNLWTSLRI